MPLLKILIAEDEKVTQKLFQVALPGALCHAKIVSDGDEAVRTYKEWHPDIILLDFGLPNINGFQVLKMIRRDHQDKKSVVIMVTGQSDKETILACAKLGVQGYIVKPFTSADLAQKIFKIYNEHQKKAEGQPL